ncbi:MAG: class I SAM-dependent methyltransferase [Thermoprotei archaeon]|nr:class I SAM-dependent methyltransferase [Thermoprotei archaeon]
MKGLAIRERYERTCESYDELYRGEQYEKYFIALKAVKPRGIVLDAGCGTALLAEFLKAWGVLDGLDLYVCLDYSGCMLEIAEWKLRNICGGNCITILGDVENLPFKKGVFDVTYAFTVIDLLDDPLRGLEEMLRVTRGEVVVSTLKRLPYKDMLLNMEFKVIGESSKDLIFKVK